MRDYILLYADAHFELLVSKNVRDLIRIQVAN